MSSNHPTSATFQNAQNKSLWCECVCVCIRIYVYIKRLRGKNIVEIWYTNWNLMLCVFYNYRKKITFVYCWLECNKTEIESVKLCSPVTQTEIYFSIFEKLFTLILHLFVCAFFTHKTFISGLRSRKSPRMYNKSNGNFWHEIIGTA